MMMMTEALVEVLAEVPAGPWLAIVIDDIDVDRVGHAGVPAGVSADAGVVRRAAVHRRGDGAAQTRIWTAKRLRRLLPNVWRAMRDGDLPDSHVAALIDATRSVDDAQLRLMVIDPDDGRLLHRAAHTYRPTPNQVAHVRATYIFSVGPTQIGTLIPLDRPWHCSKTKKATHRHPITKRRST